MCLSRALVPSVKSGAEDVSGEQAAAVSEQQDENSQRLEEVTGMDEDGSVYDLDDSTGTVKESGFSLFSRSASVQVVKFSSVKSISNYKVSGGRRPGAQLLKRRHRKQVTPETWPYGWLFLQLRELSLLQSL